MKKFAALLLTIVMLLSVSIAQAEETPETQIDKALALIDTFASGDTELAASLLDENYIQHNLAYGTGRDAFVASVEGLAAAETPTTVGKHPRLRRRRICFPAHHLQLCRGRRAGGFRHLPL